MTRIKVIGLIFLTVIFLTANSAFANADGCNVLNVKRDLTLGSKDSIEDRSVFNLQMFLRTKGFFNQEPTGYFGPITQKAVQQYQESRKVYPSVGFVGPLTKSQMTKDCSQIGTQEDGETVYFEASDGAIGMDNRFVVGFRDQDKIDQARELIRTNDKITSVGGILVTEPISWNPGWNYHISPETTFLFEIAVEVCDANAQFIEDNLDEIDAGVLPDNKWCPWQSYLVKEIKQQEESFLLIFQENGANEILIDRNLNTGESTVLPGLSRSSTETKRYVFLGWSETKYGRVKYQAGDSYTMGSQNTTLYAVWSEEPTKLNPIQDDPIKIDDSTTTGSRLISSQNIFPISDLELGIKDGQVLKLQKYLNSNGYIVESVSGQPGSLGYETNYFGEKTKQALIKFQLDKGITPVQGYFGPKTRGVMGI